jgi:outer membrane protein TolC
MFFGKEPNKAAERGDSRQAENQAMKLLFSAPARLCKALFRSGAACLASAALAWAQSPEATQAPDPRSLSLQNAIQHALLENRQLQIERSRQEVAEFTLKAAYGAYDPRFESRLTSEAAADTGGFDPADFSNDAIYNANSETATLGLTGLLPTGLTYQLGGNFAHSDGQRNFFNFDSYRAGTGIYLEQPLLKNLWIDQPRWTIQINKRNLKITELGVQFVAMSVINSTQQGYYDLVYAWENLRVYKDLVQTKQNFLKGVQRQVELGTLTALDERFAQSQAAALQTDVISASNTVAMASNQLRTLMGVTGTNWTQQFLLPTDYLLLVPAELNLQQSWQTGLLKRPDYLQMAVNVDSADLTIKFRKNQLFPSLNVIGSYGLRGSDAVQAFPPDEPRAASSRAFEEIQNQSAPNSMVGLLFSIPLTSTAERNNYKASKELKKQADLLLKQKQEFILREISDALDLAKYSLSRVEAARQASVFADQALKAEEQRLLGGSGSIFFVLEAQTETARAKIAELLARRDYNKALSQLYFCEGTLLERSNIRLQFDE